MDPELIALLARIGDLTAEELADLDTRLRAYFAQIDEEGPGEDMTAAEHAALLTQIAEGVEQVGAESTRRVEAQAAEAAEAERIAAEAEAQREAARARLNPPAAEPAAEAEAEEEAGAEEREPVAASVRTTRPARRPALASMGTQRPATAAPEQRTEQGPRIRTSLVAAGDVRGFSTGQELTDWQQVGQALVARLRGLGHVADGIHDEQVLVASMGTQYPETHVLKENDPEGNSARLEALFEAPAVVAAGGLCTPLPVDYTIAEVGSLDRPFRGSKTRVGAERGGIQTTVPPSLTQADAGVGIWTLANDVNPGDVSVPAAERLATKPVIEFDCGTSRSSYVYAVTLRTRYNNMRAKYNPEVVASNARMGLVSHSRLAELRLMNLQVALSTAVTSAALLGASKDLFGTLDGVVARMRYRQRRPDTQALRATFPTWVKSMLRADFVRQMPAHNSPTDQYAVADATMEAMFRARNVNVTWLTEDLDGGAAGGIGAAQGAGALLDFPDTFRWFIEWEGEVVFLDGGELDLGVVRDSALNAVNKFETFFETFEGLHFRGSEAPLVVTSTMNPNGSAAGLIATATGNATADL